MNHLEQLSLLHNNIKILPQDELVDTPVKGIRYHLSWASKRGMVWVLQSVQGSRCIMKTPFTKKKLTANVKDLRHTNKRIVEKAKKRLKHTRIL